MGRNFREMFERVRITKLMNLAKSRRSESLSQIAESWAVSRGALTKQTTSSKNTQKKTVWTICDLRKCFEKEAKICMYLFKYIFFHNLIG